MSAGAFILLGMAEAERQKRNQRSKNNSKNSKNNNNNYDYSSSKDYTYIDYLEQYIQDRDTFLFNFFKKLYDEFVKNKNEHNDEIRKVIDELNEKLKPYTEKQEELQEVDIKIFDNMPSRHIILFKKNTFNYDELNEKNYRYNSEKKRLEKALLMLNELQEREKHLKKRLKIEIRPKRREPLKRKLVETINGIKDCNRDIDSAKEYINDFESLLELDSYHKGQLNDIFNATNEINNIKKEISKKQKEIINLYDLDEYQNNFFLQFIEEAKNNGLITDEELEKAFQEMDDIIVKAENNEIDMHVTKWYSYDLMNFIKAFIKNIYNPEEKVFVDDKSSIKKSM